LLLAEAGVKYTDKRVEFKDWGALKPTTPLGSLPLYTDKTGVTLCQSAAIARYIAAENGLHGASNIERGQIDMYVDTLLELMDIFIDACFHDPAMKDARLVELQTKIDNVFPVLEKVVAKNSGGFYVGNKVSLADIVSYAVVDGLGLEAQGKLDKYPALQKHTTMVRNRPKIQQWEKTRPKTDA